MELALARPVVGAQRKGRRGEVRPVTALEPAALYREHGDGLFRYLVRMSGDPDVAADVLQDTFLRLVERPPRSMEHVKAWLFQVATNRLRDIRRTQSRRGTLTNEEVVRGALADPPVAPDRAAERAETAHRVRMALTSLSERDRSILLMREEGFAHREIAEAVGTTTGSVGTLIARALTKLGRALAEESGTSTPGSETPHDG